MNKRVCTEWQTAEKNNFVQFFSLFFFLSFFLKVCTLLRTKNTFFSLVVISPDTGREEKRREREEKRERERLAR